MGGFADCFRMILGWWSSPLIYEPLCFDLVIEEPTFSLNDDASDFSLVNDMPEFNLQGKDC